jgi:hypothetical protein
MCGSNTIPKILILVARYLAAFVIAAVLPPSVAVQNTTTFDEAIPSDRNFDKAEFRLVQRRTIRPRGCPQHELLVPGKPWSQRNHSSLDNPIDCPACEHAGQDSTSITRIVIAPAAIETSGLKATLLETSSPNRKDIGHFCPAFREVLYPHAQRVLRAAPEFRRDIPLLRLLVVSKAGEIVVVVFLSHDVPRRNTRTRGETR